MLKLRPSINALFSNRIHRNHHKRLQFYSGARRFYSSTTNDDNIVKSDIPIDRVTGITIPEMVWANVRRSDWENCTAFECAVTGEKISHDQVYQHSRSFAAALLKMELRRRGDTVGVVLPNNPNYASVLYGIWDAGMIASPVNPGYQAEEMIRQLNDSEAKCVVTIPAFLPIIRAYKKSSPILKYIIVIGEPHEGCHTYSEMIKVETDGANFLKGSEIDTVNEVALLPYSSGTTGLPKGVLLTHSSITTQLTQALNPGILSYSEGRNRTIAVVPFFHSYGFITFSLIGILLGSHAVSLPKFNPELYLQVVRKHKPTILHLVPPLIVHLVNSPEYGKEELASVETVVAGAAPIGPWLIQQLLEKAGKYFFFQELYGMTELSPGCHGLRPDTRNTKVGSCGTVWPGTSAKVITTDGTSRALGPYENGELCIKGPQIMKGYWKNEKATRETVDEDGWLHTGDIAYYDKENYFYIVDRLKELIKVKRYQVAPAELEQVLLTHPDVSDAAVIGIPHAEWGELPRAYIVSSNAKLSESDIEEFVKDKITDYKQFRGGIEFIDAIPKAPSGKILRRELKRFYNERH